LARAKQQGKTRVIFKEGTHTVEGDYAVIESPMEICGRGQNKTFIQGGGFKIKERNNECSKHVVLKHMSVTAGPSGSGLWGRDCLFFVCECVTFVRCGVHGIYALNTKGRLINCLITQCGRDGIFCGSNAVIELKGSQMKVDGNNAGGFSRCYGLHAWDGTSFIHLLLPLTKESVSTNNFNGQNCGSGFGGGIIDTVNRF
jgi:hypothetical protein